jgi:large subunit ribosomal protein L6
MSRVAKAPVTIPDNVEVIIEPKCVTIKGPKGSLIQNCNHLVDVSQKGEAGNQVHFKPAKNEPNAWAQAGTMRSLVNNMVHGVTKGYDITLELVGVGYRAQAKGSDITLSLGYSHTIDYILPAGITAEFPSNTVIVLRGIDKQRIGQVASEIRAFRPPEPYKGKGVKYAGERINRKETKKK